MLSISHTGTCHARTALGVALTRRPRPKWGAGLVKGHTCDVHYLENAPLHTLLDIQGCRCDFHSGGGGFARENKF